MGEYMTNNLNEASTNNPNQDHLNLKIDRLYVKEISCKIPHAPGLYEVTEFKENMGQMSSSVEMNIKTQPIAKDQYEVVLHVIIHGKAKNISLFVLDVQQAGIFTLRVPASNVEEVIKNYCVGFLHPYLSQVVTNTVVQAGFPPIVLQPQQPILDQTTTSESGAFVIKNKESSFNSVKSVQGILEPSIS